VRRVATYAAFGRFHCLRPVLRGSLTQPTTRPQGVQKAGSRCRQSEQT